MRKAFSRLIFSCNRLEPKQDKAKLIKDSGKEA